MLQTLFVIMIVLFFLVMFQGYLGYLFYLLGIISQFLVYPIRVFTFIYPVGNWVYYSILMLFFVYIVLVIFKIVTRIKSSH